MLRSSANDHSAGLACLVYSHNPQPAVNRMRFVDLFCFFQVMRESLAKLENLCLGGTAKDQDWMAAVEDTRWARVKLAKSTANLTCHALKCSNKSHRFGTDISLFDFLFVVPMCVPCPFPGLRWLSHVRTVLSAAWTVAFKAHTQRTPVLVHCSHGWDRTSQVGGIHGQHLRLFLSTVNSQRHT